MHSINSTFAFILLFELTTLEIEITDFYSEFYVKTFTFKLLSQWILW